MDQEGFLDLAGVLAFQVIDQLMIVTMSAEGIDGVDVGGYGVFIAEDGDGLGTGIGQQSCP